MRWSFQITVLASCRLEIQCLYLGRSNCAFQAFQVSTTGLLRITTLNSSIHRTFHLLHIWVHWPKHMSAWPWVCLRHQYLYWMQDSEHSNEPVSPFDSYETMGLDRHETARPMDVPLSRSSKAKNSTPSARQSLESAPGLLEGRDIDNAASMSPNGMSPSPFFCVQ